MKYITTISLILLILGCNTNKKSINSIEKEYKHESIIDSLATAFLNDTLMNSLSIGIYHNGEEFIKHYGELDPSQNNKPTNQTIYDIASLTKTFVGTLIKQAEIEGKLSIENDIRDYLKGDYPNLEYENQPIKVRHLITHTSRLPRYLPTSILDEFSIIDASLPIRMSKIEMAYSKNLFLNDLSKIQIDTFPGYKYAYSNAGAELASYILENVYNLPFEELLEKKLWSKANMTSSSINLNVSQKKYYANGYGDYQNVTPPMQTNLWGGSGYGKSTIADLLNYIKYQLDEQNEVVQQSHKILFDKAIIDNDPRVKIGYMWQVSTDKDFGKLIKHHGGGNGVQNYMFIYPEEELGITIITNQSGWHTAGKLLNVVNGLLDEMAKEKIPITVDEK